MDSEKKEASQADETRLCEQCSNFYGGAHTNYLCSKCFRENQQKQESAVSKLASMSVKTADEEKKAVVIEEPEEAPKKAIQENKSRCWKCSKKVGLIGFDCKCGFVFCSKHRHVEDHDCDHDYFSEAKEKLKKNNPVVSFEKVSKL